jgi:uncharacterized protein YecE (DUF72 family)
MTHQTKVGCCGFPCPQATYAQTFKVVEVQQTFYQPPRIATLENWRQSVPPDFEFTLKAWQLITHTAKSPTFRRLKAKLTTQELAECGSFQDTDTVHQAWSTTLDCAHALGANLVLFQCPASFLPTNQNIRQMRGFFGKVERAGLTFLWEPRGNWEERLIRELCVELKLIHVVDPFVSRSTAKDLLYLRLHGGKDFRHVFTEEELWTVAGLFQESKKAYVMFNNIKMWDDAQRFQSFSLQKHTLV